MVAVVVALFLGGGSVAPCLAGYTAPEAQAACAQAYAERLGPWERFAYDNPTGATLAIGLIAFLFVLAGGFALRRAATR
jgi:hypothetical protein